MHRFSIIIVSWNALHHLKKYLPSVVKTDYTDFEIILSDNNSEDDSVSWVRKYFPEIKIAAMDRNYGYCGGNNRAVPYSKGDILVFLNNDVKVDSQWLSELDKTFSFYPEAAVVQPKIKAVEQPDSFEYAGAAGGYIDKYGYPFCRGRIFQTLERDVGQYDEESEIFWASGAAMAVRKSHFEKTGGFDEDFEFHMEEIDFCWRTWNMGNTVRYNPRSVVYHLGGGSLPMGHPQKVRYNFRNNLVMIVKNSTKKTLLKRMTARYILDMIAAFHALLTGRVYDFEAIMKAHFEFWRMFYGTLEKRRKLQAQRKIHKESDIPVKNINLVIEYFIKGRKKYHEIFH